MGLCLLDWSAWRRLPKMSRVDAVAFLATAISVLAVNAVLAVAIGCSIYGLKYVFGLKPLANSRRSELSADRQAGVPTELVS
jgi:MFS superfamily sulfate permease-like transporter